MNQNTKNLFLAAAVAGMLSAGVGSTARAEAGDAAKQGATSTTTTKSTTTTTTTAESTDPMGKCIGANACKGKSDCNTATSGCAGQNSCKHKGWLKMTEKECKKKHKKAKWEKMD